MASVKIYNDQFEKGLRKFKKQCMAEGILQEIRERQFFEKPSQKRKRDKAAAKMRWQRKQRESNPQNKQDY